MSTTVSVSHYEYQGQVYSPAFSEPPSPSSSTSSNPASPRLRKRDFEDNTCEFRSKVPKYANKYEEMLQPLSPVTILSSGVKRPLPAKTHLGDFDAQLQNQFEDLLAVACVEEVEEFLNRHTDCLDIDAFNSEGRTAFQQSCLEGNLPLAKVLVKFGANIRCTTRDGFSTFHLAVFSGHSHLMSYILSLQSQRWKRPPFFPCSKLSVIPWSIQCFCLPTLLLINNNLCQPSYTQSYLVCSLIICFSWPEIQKDKVQRTSWEIFSAKKDVTIILTTKVQLLLLAWEILTRWEKNFFANPKEKR